MKELSSKIKNEKDPEKVKTLKNQMDTEIAAYQKIKSQDAENTPKMSADTKKKIAIGTGIGLGAAAIAGAVTGIAVSTTQDNGIQTPPTQPDIPTPTPSDDGSTSIEPSSTVDSSSSEPTY